MFLETGRLNVTNYQKLEEMIEFYPEFKNEHNSTFIEFLKISARFDHDKNHLKQAMKTGKHAPLNKK